MAELKLSGNMKISTIKKQFKEVFGLSLRLYKGNKFADGDATLASIRSSDVRGSSVKANGNMKVGNFENKLKNQMGITVQVAGSDDSYLCKDGITLAKAAELDGKRKDKSKINADIERNEVSELGEELKSESNGKLEKISLTEIIWSIDSKNGTIVPNPDIHSFYDLYRCCSEILDKVAEEILLHGGEIFPCDVSVYYPGIPDEYEPYEVPDAWRDIIPRFSPEEDVSNEAIEEKINEAAEEFMGLDLEEWNDEESGKDISLKEFITGDGDGQYYWGQDLKTFGELLNKLLQLREIGCDIEDDIDFVPQYVDTPYYWYKCIDWVTGYSWDSGDSIDDVIGGSYEGFEDEYYKDFGETKLPWVNNEDYKEYNNR